AAVGQTYRFRRRVDEEQLARVRDYTSRNPDDATFAVEAAYRLIGNDAGGSGPEGEARRAAARALLEPQIGRTGASARPYAMLAIISMREGRYRAADSLLRAARRGNPDDLSTIHLHALVHEALDDPKQALEAYQAGQRIQANEAFLLSSITALYRLGRDAEARAAEERYFLLASAADSGSVWTSRVFGLLGGMRCEEARKAIEGAGPERLAANPSLEAEYLRLCGSPRRAAEIFERLIEANPLAAMLSNNLAWTYVQLGDGLDRAEELATTASLLNPDDLSIRNTLAVIAMRKGRTAEAKRTLGAMLEMDDRPVMQVVNRYFLALIDWHEGRKTEARRAWSEILPLANEEWSTIVKRTIAVAERGGTPEEGLLGAAQP
ncbi:MAG TPA: hypothetical protein VFT32_04335, partial [Candidatus Eisenbacteria bacterium]|nr:hypothetical protein [Candidatus Eisenbacteria bacterium]